MSGNPDPQTVRRRCARCDRIGERQMIPRINASGTIDYVCENAKMCRTRVERASRGAATNAMPNGDWLLTRSGKGRARHLSPGDDDLPRGTVIKALCGRTAIVVHWKHDDPAHPYYDCGPCSDARLPRRIYDRIMAEARPEGECLVWKRQNVRRPLVWIAGKNQHASAFVYAFVNGPPSEGFHVHHLCENKWCVNVEHLEALSNADHRRRHNELRARAASPAGAR